MPTPSSQPDPSVRLAGSRIGPLDTFRCLTVTLALLSHAILEFHVDAVTDPGVWLAVRSVTRSSTPGLLLLFGVMAEVVHFRRYEALGPALRPRILRRVAQCYSAFVGLAVLVAVCRPESVAYVLRSVGFLTLEGYNVIFALYFFLLLLLFALLPIRARGGFGGLGLVLAAIWTADALVVGRLPLAAEPIRTIADITLGTGGTWGPSAFHSVSLVIAGMALGNVLYVRDRARGSGALVAALVLVSAGLVAVEMSRVGVGGFFSRIVDMATYRAHNAPVYYAYGLLGAGLTVPLAYLIDAIAPPPLRRRIHSLGSKTFSYFVLGNVVLILIPEYAAPSLRAAVAEVGLYLLASAAATLLWARFGPRGVPGLRRYSPALKPAGD